MLLVHHTYGALNWELPGGSGEQGESPAETAVREVYEETSLTVSASGMTGCYFMPENETLHFVFRCDVSGTGEMPVPDGDEISECAYWPLNSLPRPISDWTVKRIHDAVSGSCIDMPMTIGPRIWLE